VTTNYLVWDFVKPSQWLVWTAVLAIVFWWRRFGLWCVFATSVAVVLLALLPVGLWLIKPLEARFAIPVNVGSVDGIIVLAGSEQVKSSERHSQPQIGEAGDRLTTFLALARAQPDARLVYTGAYQSAVARLVLVGAGLSEERVQFDELSKNTCESAVATRALAGAQSGGRWLLVTSASHMPRTMACFRASDWEVVPYPTDFRAGRWRFSFLDNLDLIDTAVHEWLGLLYYRARGLTHELFPAPR
jgi:uncharacterized SAM-binding protein YcdF (DUF218 family)